MDNWIDNLRRIGLKRYGDENRRILSELLRNGIPAGIKKEPYKKTNKLFVLD